jgi:hypothetical protein
MGLKLFSNIEVAKNVGPGYAYKYCISAKLNQFS